VPGSGARARQRPAGALTPGRPTAGPAPPRPYAHGSTCSGYSVGSTREARARLTSGHARSSERGQRPNNSWRTDTRPALVARSGRPHECRLVLGKAFRHLAFDLGAWLGQPVVVIAPPLLQPRLVAVGPVGDPMGGDGIQQLVIQLQAACGVVGGPELQQRLK